MKKSNYWTTVTEKKFIDGIGSWAGKKDAVLLLRNYVKSCSFREKWGDIDKHKTIQHAKSRLKSLMQAGKV